MRVSLLFLALISMAACSPSVPDSGAGVGFEDYNSYVKGAPDPAPVGTLPPSGFSPDTAAAAIDRATGAAPAQTPAVIPQAPQPGASSENRPRGNAPAGIKVEEGEMVHIQTGVSDEQDFEAVKARETIASDKARIEKNRAQYQVDQPGTLPQRATDDVPNIVAFALSTSHPVGTQMYARSGIRLTSSKAACNKYGSPDLAQEAFLAAGGPEKDRKGLDADGDGFACDWNPDPFRKAVQ